MRVRLRALTACDSARRAWHTGCVFSLRDGICCHPVVWILTLYCLTVMASHWQIDMTHSPAGSLLSDQFVCYGVISSWPAALKRGWMVREDHSNALIIISLQSFTHCCSSAVTVQVINLKNQILLLLLISCITQVFYITADGCNILKNVCTICSGNVEKSNFTSILPTTAGGWVIHWCKYVLKMWKYCCFCIGENLIRCLLKDCYS